MKTDRVSLFYSKKKNQYDMSIFVSVNKCSLYLKILLIGPLLELFTFYVLENVILKSEQSWATHLISIVTTMILLVQIYFSSSDAKKRGSTLNRLKKLFNFKRAIIRILNWLLKKEEGEIGSTDAREKYFRKKNQTGKLIHSFLCLDGLRLVLF
jgi:hypothetical protein